MKRFPIYSGHFFWYQSNSLISSYIAVVQSLSHVRLCWPHGLLHSRLPCPSPSPGACSNSSSLSRWCHPTILSSVIPFSSCLQYFPALVSFLMSWKHALWTDGQSIGVSVSASVLLMNIQDWFPFGLTPLGLKCLKSIIQNHQFFSVQHSLWSSSHIHTWLLKKIHSFDYMDLCCKSNVSAFKYTL